MPTALAFTPVIAGEAGIGVTRYTWKRYHAVFFALSLSIQHAGGAAGGGGGAGVIPPVCLRGAEDPVLWGPDVTSERDPHPVHAIPVASPCSLGWCPYYRARLGS